MVIVSRTTLLIMETLLAGKLEHQVFMTAATPDRPAQLGRKDNQPTAYGRLEPRATQVWCQHRPGCVFKFRLYGILCLVAQAYRQYAVPVNAWKRTQSDCGASKAPVPFC